MISTALSRATQPTPAVAQRMESSRPTGVRRDGGTSGHGATAPPNGSVRAAEVAPVARYDAASLADTLRAVSGVDWQRQDEMSEEHHTPAGAMQPFTWVVLRRQAEPLNTEPLNTAVS